MPTVKRLSLPKRIILVDDDPIQLRHRHGDAGAQRCIMPYLHRGEGRGGRTAERTLRLTADRHPDARDQRFDLLYLLRLPISEIHAPFRLPP